MKKLLLIFFIISCKTQIINQNTTYDSNDARKSQPAKIPTRSKTNLYFIRHAESNGNQINNPHLNARGKKRVTLLEKYFSDKELDTIFTTNVNRTFDTAKGIAVFKNTPIVYYDPFKMSFKDFFKNHKNSNSLIIGHSNTTPDFVNGIIGIPKYSQMVEDNYSDIYKISLSVNNKLFDILLNLENEIQKIEDAKLSPKELKKVLKARKKAAKNK